MTINHIHTPLACVGATVPRHLNLLPSMSTIVTSPVADIPLNGVPSGHYYVSVAAVNIVGQGQSAQGSFTGINKFNSYQELLLSLFLQW